MTDKHSGPFAQAVAAAKKARESNSNNPTVSLGMSHLMRAGTLAINTKSFPALVAKVTNNFTLTINRGSDHGINKGDRFLVYSIDPEELIDPETGESLGHLEIIRGTGVATHVQQKMTTIESDSYAIKGRTIRRQSGAFAAISGETIEEPEKRQLPFDSPEVKDKVKPVN